jgi:geranylgeranyl pyrophosphate synthase
MSDFSEQLKRAMNEVERVLQTSLEGSSVLEDMGTRLIEAGGKRLRPELLVISYLAGGGEDVSETVDIAAAFELIHTASLIHDDITDDPTLRRRRPAPHRRYGLSRALVAGDYIFAKSFELLAHASEDVSRAIAEAALTTAEGEHLELLRSFDAKVTHEQHVEIMEKKTAAIFVAAARVGGLLSGMEPDRLEALESYARDLGLAFQITDDVLDLEPTAALTGKPSGMDLREGRMNSVIFTALAKLDEADRDTVVRVFMASSPSTVDVEKALALVRSTGAGGIATQQAQKHVEAAIEALGDAFTGPERAMLEGIAMEVISRRS